MRGIVAKLKQILSSKNKVELKINLSELFDTKFPDNDALKQAVGQAVIDKIVERTQDGKDINGKEFVGYSKEYMKLTGKDDPPNLTLFGDMLGLLDIKQETPETITIGWNSKLENNKAFAHITGYEGHPTIKKGPVRDFLGLTEEDVNSIVDEFSSDVSDLAEFQDAADAGNAAEASLQAIRNILSDNGEG